MSNPEDYRGLALGIVVGVLGIAAAILLPRLARPASLQDVALRDARARIGAGDPTGAYAILAACAFKDRTACECADGAEELAVDANRSRDGLKVLIGMKSCTSPRHIGGMAEAQVGAGLPDQGLMTAEQALARNPDEPHACFAKAWALSTKAPSPEALGLAQKAVDGGRGLPALLLLATLRAGAGDKAGERQALEQAARARPDDAHVAYDIGVMEAESGEHHYRQAREAFLHALALDPKLVDARYQLAVLTITAKAYDEARHDVDELAAIAPDDPRIPGLRAALAAVQKAKLEAAPNAGSLVVSRP
jgi:tetratricopeptide (TPR) repeat protein